MQLDNVKRREMGEGEGGHFFMFSYMDLSEPIS